VELTHFSRETDPTVVADHLRAWGYAIVDDVADHATMDRLAAETEPFVSRSDTGRDEYDGRNSRGTGALIARCPTSRELVMHPIVLGSVGDQEDPLAVLRGERRKKKSVGEHTRRSADHRQFVRELGPEAHSTPSGDASR
jgi:hypothetical protein